MRVMVSILACVAPSTVHVAPTVAVPLGLMVTAELIVYRAPFSTDSTRLPAMMTVPGVPVRVSVTLDGVPGLRCVPVSEQITFRSTPIALFGSFELYACCPSSSSAPHTSASWASFRPSGVDS